MVTGDGAYIKKLNRNFILGKIVEHGMISRAELSKVTGLNKATISVQVAELLDTELIFETQQEHNVVGRRPIMLSLNRKVGCVLGIDLDYKEITYTLSDLLGFPLFSDTYELNSSNYDEIRELIANQIKSYQIKSADRRYGLVSVVIAIHGTVGKDETIFFIPQHQWRNKNLKADLEKDIEISVHIENNANLCAFAEKIFKHHHSDNLLCISMYSGIGLGIIMDGEVIKGYHGYAGEMGHMVLFPDGLPCKCGNKGCWELYASEASLFSLLSQKMNKKDIGYQDIQHWINTREPEVCEHMNRFIKHLSIGLNNIINLYNPETIVLNSELLHLYPNAIEEIKANLTSSVSQYRELVISDLGKNASIMGACAFGIKKFLEIPELSLELSDRLLPIETK
ncbi:ROK family protein [Aquibacillus halophilus]|uniref:ROK family protein n=1 Tax=Aquibacillus halophilus TaxID=930132 RepID=A0A6A8DHE6_9BACI|nr:ROK family transcriptional regulator [Aquibacillus halophilus]MRH45125.1 ROK family protein [Aquibacillus halophilus]